MDLAETCPSIRRHDQPQQGTARPACRGLLFPCPEGRCYPILCRWDGEKPFSHGRQPSCRRCAYSDGLPMSPRRITVSTAGVAKMIRQLGDDKVKFKLALSLHAANDAKRNEIMPVNETNNIKALIEALNYFYQQTGNEITFEYILFQNFNDSRQDADDLIKIYRQVPADLINIIEYNPIEQALFSKPEDS